MKIISLRSILLTIRLVNIIVLARIVSVETYGVYIVLITALTILSEISHIGLNAYLQREVFAKTIDPTSFAIYVSRRSSLTYILLVMFPSIFYGHVNNLDLIVVILIPIFLIIEKNFELFVVHFIAVGKIKIIEYSVVISSVISSFFLFLYAFDHGMEIDSYFWIRLFASLPLALAVLQISYKKFDSKRHPSVTRTLQNFGIIHLANSLRSSDIVFVSILTNATQVGLYSASSKLILPFLIFITLASPYFANYCSNKNLSQIHRLKNALKFLLIGLIFIFSIFAFFSSFIMNLIYGSTFMQAANVLAIMALSMPFVIANPLFAMVAIREGKENILMKATVGHTVILILLVSVGALLQGALGAAWGFLIASAVRSQYLAFLK